MDIVVSCTEYQETGRKSRKIADFLPVLSIYFRLSINFYWKLRVTTREYSDTSRDFLADLLPWSKAAQKKCNSLKKVPKKI